MKDEAVGFFDRRQKLLVHGATTSSESGRRRPHEAPSSPTGHVENRWKVRFPSGLYVESLGFS